MTLTFHKCAGCGAPLLIDESICHYCGMSYSFVKNQISSNITDDHLVISRKSLEVLINEISFLQKQFELTGHPSIPKKIELARKKIDYFKANHKFDIGL